MQTTSAHTKKCNGKYPLHCLLTKIGSQASGRGLFEICQILSPSLNSFQILVMTPLKIWSPPPARECSGGWKTLFKNLWNKKKFPSASPISREPYFSGFMVFPWNLLLDSLFLRFCCSSKLNAKSGFKITACCTLSSDGFYFFCCQNCVWAQKMPSSSHCKKPPSASSASMLVLLWQVEPCNYLWRQSIFPLLNNCGQFLRNTSSPD